MSVDGFISQLGLSPVCDTDTMYSESRQVDTVVNHLSQSGPVPQHPHDDSTVTSPDVIDSIQWYPFQLLQLLGESPMTGQWVDTGNPALTLSQSAPLAQDYGAVTFPLSTTLCQTPGAPQTFQDHNTIVSPDINGTTFDYLTPGAPQPQYVPLEQQVGYLFHSPSQSDLPTLPSQINGTTPPATTTSGNPKQCPACQAIFGRRQERDRHLLSYLPHWIHCPLPHCLWRGNRVTSFELHWQRQDHQKYGCTPGREQFEIFDPQEFQNQIIAGTIPAVAADQALERVRAKADQLQKQSMSTNPWGYKLKRAPQ